MSCDIGPSGNRGWNPPSLGGIGVIARDFAPVELHEEAPVDVLVIRLSFSCFQPSIWIVGLAAVVAALSF
jgi:hypothetical protein